jgi:hypothetical protein
LYPRLPNDVLTLHVSDRSTPVDNSRVAPLLPFRSRKDSVDEVVDSAVVAGEVVVADEVVEVVDGVEDTTITASIVNRPLPSNLIG